MHYPSRSLLLAGCFFAAATAGMAADAAFSHVFASGNPVHAATGVKVLNDEADLDFTAPAHFPLRWQRCYNSLNPRSGMHGPGWSTLFDEVILLEGDRAAWHEQSGRTLSFTLPEPDGALYSVSEGLIIRRNPQGDVLIADDDGAGWRLFRATPGQPQRLRLATLSDEYANALESEWGAQGRLVAVRDEGDALEVRLHYGDTRFPDRLADAWQHRDGERWLARGTFTGVAPPAGRAAQRLRLGAARPLAGGGPARQPGRRLRHPL